VHRPAVMPVPALALRLMFGEMADEALLASTRALPGKLIRAGFRFEQGTIEAALESAVGR
jgi:NAD dependent epimerase/dehydratase family enzyme